MNLYLIKNVKNPINKFDAVNKAYVDRVKYKSATGIIPNTIMTDHTLFTFPNAKAFANGKIIIFEMWVQRLAGECQCSQLRGLTFTSFPEVRPL